MEIPLGMRWELVIYRTASFFWRVLGSRTSAILESLSIIVAPVSSRDDPGLRNNTEASRSPSKLAVKSGIPAAEVRPLRIIKVQSIGGLFSSCGGVYLTSHPAG